MPRGELVGDGAAARAGADDHDHLVVVVDRAPECGSAWVAHRFAPPLPARRRWRPRRAARGRRTPRCAGPAASRGRRSRGRGSRPGRTTRPRSRAAPTPRGRCRATTTATPRTRRRTRCPPCRAGSSGAASSSSAAKSPPAFASSDSSPASSVSRCHSDASICVEDLVGRALVGAVGNLGVRVGGSQHPDEGVACPRAVVAAPEVSAMVSPGGEACDPRHVRNGVLAGQAR